MRRGGSMEAERKVLRLLHGRKTRRLLPEIHAHFLRQGLHQSNQILAHFVSVCGHFGRMEYANRVYQMTQNPSILLFNSMIKGFSLNGPFQESLRLFSSMKRCGIWPDEYSFAPLLKACSSLGDVRLGQCVHGEIISVGFGRFGSIQVGVLELYSCSGRMEDAKKMLDEMSQRDLIVWNLMIKGFCKMGNVDMALCLFRQMSERNVVSWNSMIAFLAQSRRDGEALALFCEMWEQGFEPDEATIVTVLPVCARLVALEVGQRIHTYAESSGLYQKVVSVGNALVDFYCKCGNLETATRVFNEMPHKNVVSWNAMISGLALNGKGEAGVELFEVMLRKGERPNDATFLAVLTCCDHAGLLEKGKELFASMSQNHSVDPKLEHYGCMVDLLARNGFVRIAYDLIKSMPMVPNATIWGALLGACHTYGDVELAELAIKELISLEPWNSGNYVLLSNIYAEEGKWGELEKVRGMMNEKSVMKAPATSFASTINLESET